MADFYRSGPFKAFLNITTIFLLLFCLIVVFLQFLFYSAEIMA